MNHYSKGLMGSAALGALLVGATGAVAGGLGVREQSASSLGAAFAGSAAGGDLSSSFWNSAAMGVASDGLSSESHYSLIAPNVDVTSNSISVLPGSAVPANTRITGDTINLDRPALVGASYAAWRMNKDFVLGVAINSPFGLANETSNQTWSGQNFFRSAKLFTINANPMASYQVMPGVHIGAGVQIQYAKLNFKANPSSALAPQQENSVLDGEDTSFGYTLGVLLQPNSGTSIGIGYRSAVHHTLNGSAFMANGTLVTGVGAGAQPFTPIGFDAKLTTPDIATVSFRQAMSPTTRLLGTVEWTGWSKVDQISFLSNSSGGLLGLGAAGTTKPGTLLNNFDFHWNDGWLFSVGGEYDYSKALTLRTGIGYEISPIQNSDQRKANITDSDRVWLAGGATYKWSPSTSFDLGYTHIFFADGAIDQRTTTPGSSTTPVRQFLGSVSQSADIISLSMKTKW